MRSRHGGLACPATATASEQAHDDIGDSVSELPPDARLHLLTVTGVFDRVVQEAPDGSVLTTAVLKHQRRDRHEVCQVGDARPLAQLPAVNLTRYGERSLEALRQQRGGCAGFPHDWQATRP